MELDYPRIVLAGFAVAVAIALLVAGSTTGGAFGSYNPAWDGTSEFRSLAEDGDADATIARNTSAYSTTDPDGTLAVILSPAERYGDGDATAVREFVADGGTLLVAEDVGPNGNRLLRAAGARTRFDGAPLRDERNYENGPSLPVATTVRETATTAGVDDLVLNHGTAIRVNGTTADESETPMAAVDETNATVLAASSSYGYLDRDGDEALDDAETVARYPVVTVESVGEGRVIAVGDPSLFINTMLELGDNRAFAQALVASHDRVVLDVSHAGALPPLPALVLTLRESALLQAVVGGSLLAALVGRDEIGAAGAEIAQRIGHDDPEPTPRDREAVIRGVAARNPEWDADRVERVTQAIMERRPEGETDD